MIPCRRGSTVLRGWPPMLSESCRCSGSMPRSPRARATRGTPATAPRAKKGRARASWPQLLFAGVVDHALNLDDVLLVARIEQQFRTSAGPRQVDFDDLLDAPGRPRHHHDPVIQKHRLIDRMGNEQHRFPIALPNVEQ